MMSGGPGRSRTADQRFRKPLLYPTELRGHKDLVVCCPFLADNSPSKQGQHGAYRPERLLYSVPLLLHAVTGMMRYHLSIAVHMAGHRSLSTAPSRVITLPF